MSSLSHHGIKGQRWGVRRYQNKDGTRTAAGKDRDVKNNFRKKLAKAGMQMVTTDMSYAHKPSDLAKQNSNFINKDASTNILKKGSIVNRFAGDNEPLDDKRKYVSFTPNDKEQYYEWANNDMLGIALTDTPHLYEYELTKDIRIASGKAVSKIICDDLKNKKIADNPKYDAIQGRTYAEAIQKDMENTAIQRGVELAKIGQLMVNDKEKRHLDEIKKEADQMRAASSSARQAYLNDGSKAHDRFMKRMNRTKYDAYVDLFDTSYNGYGAEYPLVIMNPKDKLRLKKKTNIKDVAFGAKHTSIGGTMYIEDNALILGDSSYLEHHGILGQKWGVRRFQNKDGTRTAAGKKRDAENLKSSQEAKNVNSKIHSYINKQLSSEDLDTGKSNYDFASDLIKDPDFEKVIMPVVQDIRQTKAKYGNKEPYELTGDEHQAYMNDISRIDNKAGELAITIGLAEKGESHKKSTPSEGEYERVDMFRYALARYLDEHSPDGYSDEGDWIYHSSMEGTFFIEDGTLYLSHHGIRGQRWGVRRFQNRDGSLTNAGRKRLGYATKGVTQTVSKAFKAGVKVGGNAVKAAKAHHEKKEAEKLQKKKEKASKTRLGVMANKDLFTNEEMRKLNERFKLEDEMKMATLQKGVEIAKAVGTIAQNVGTMAKAYEDVTGQSLSPIKRKAAEEKARQDKEDRERRIAREDADEARKAAKEERDIAIHEQTLRKAIASADTQEFTAQKTKAEADSSILDLYKKGQDFNGGSDATGQSWMEKAKNGGKNPFDDMIANRDPEYAQIRKEHDEKVARKERMAELDRREKERQAEKEAASKQSAPQQKQGGVDDDALFSQKGSLPIDKDRYRNNRAMEKAKQVKEDAAEERAKKQDEKAVNRTIDDTIEANRSFKETVRAQDPHAYDRGVAKDYIKGKINNLPNALADLNPINRAAKKIADKATKEEEAKVRKSMKDQYDQMVKNEGRDEANYVMYQTRVANLQQQGYSERKAKQIADSNPTFSAKRNRKKEYYEKVGELESTHRKNAEELHKANKELTDYYHKLVNGPGYDPGTPKREALDRTYRQKRGELERLEKDNNEMLEKGMKEAKKILEHSFSIQNGVLFVDSSDGLAHHGVKGQKWGVRRFQNADGSLTPKGRKHYENKIEKLKRKQVSSDAIRGTLERQHPFAVTGSAIAGAIAAGMSIAATGGASVAVIAAGSAISAAVSAGLTHATYSVSEAWEGRGTRMRSKKIAKYENMLKQSDMEEGMYHVENGTLFINAGEPYLEHHGVLGMKWGKHLRAGKGPADAPASAGGGSGEDDEKLKEMAKKAGMSVAEYRTKMAGKLGGAANEKKRLQTYTSAEAKRVSLKDKDKKRLRTYTSAEAKRISVKDKHLVINRNRSSGTRSLAVGETGEKPKSFKEKAYNALGGKYKTQAAEAHREMVQKRNDADDKARRANAQGRAANANKKAGNVREYMANKEGARQLDAEAKGARTSQWEATKKANRAQWKYDHSIAGLYDKATGKYKQAHKKTAVPKMMDRWKYEWKDGPNSKLFNNGKGKAKTAKEQAKAEVWNAADHQIKAKEHNDVANSLGGNTNYYGQMYKKAAAKEARLAEGSYRRAASLAKQSSDSTSTSSRPRARKKKYTSGGSGVTVRRPGRKPVSRTKRVTQSSTGVKRRGATGTGARVRRGA